MRKAIRVWLPREIMPPKSPENFRSTICPSYVTRTQAKPSVQPQTLSMILQAPPRAPAGTTQFCTAIFLGLSKVSTYRKIIPKILGKYSFDEESIMWASAGMMRSKVRPTLKNSEIFLRTHRLSHYSFISLCVTH